MRALRLPLLLVTLAGAASPAAFAREERLNLALFAHAAEEHADSCFSCRAMWANELAPLNDRWEPGTGRDLRNFAPDRDADIRHIRIEIDIPDMGVPRAAARQTITLSPVGGPLGTLRLNAQQMRIDAVRFAGAEAPDPACNLTWSYDDQALSLRFDPPLPAGAERSIEIEYALDNPADGMFWTTTPETDPQIHTQGQPETNRFWFPSHDFPNERSTTEIIATVPEGFMASSNGRLVSETTANGRTTWHWLQDKPHVAYLVSLVVGKFEVTDVAPAGARISMPVYAPPGRADDVRATYGRTADMVRVYEERFDEPYPWDRYAQLVVRNFGAGGMENTSATTMHDTAVFDAKSLLDGDMDGLISHELAHQWFGDLITCSTWAHIWLNEGWATYSEALWFEERDGFDAGYLYDIYQNIRPLAAADRIDAGDEAGAKRPGMVSPVYRFPGDTFGRTSNPYPKGASILHMLRVELGDELFFRAVAAYIDEHKLGTVETHDFRRTLEQVSGRSLERFFHQWCERPGTPDVLVTADWDQDRSSLRLTVEQRQFISAEHPAFAFTLPIHLEVNGETRIVTIPIDSRRHEREIELPAEPAMVAIDPGLAVLMSLEVDQPTPRLIAQLQRGPTIPSRLDAAAALGKRNGRPGVPEALEQCAANTSEHFAVRAQAARSLGALGRADELTRLYDSGIADARVRTGIMAGAAQCEGDAALALLARAASDRNESYATQAEALRGLGKRGSAEHLPTLLAALEVPSQHEQIRSAACAALASLDAKEGLDAVIAMVNADLPPRARAGAIGALGKLAHHEPDKALAVLTPLLASPVERIVTAAGAAIVDAEHQDGLAALDQFIDRCRTDEMRERAVSWRGRLAARVAGTESVEDVSAEIERLRGEIERLRHSIEEKSK